MCVKAMDILQAERRPRAAATTLSRLAAALCLLVLLIAPGGTARAQSDRQFIRRGNAFFHKRQYDKAEAEYRKAAAKNPRNPQAAYNLGCALMMRQKDSAALRQYREAGSMEQVKLRRSKAFHNAGVTYQSHKDYDRAIKAYEESLRDNPGDEETRYNLALCKRLRKNQPNRQNQQQKNRDKKNNPRDKRQDKDKDQNRDQDKEQISKDNAEQLLNAATRQERQTRQRLRQAAQKPRKRKLEKNW